MLRIMSISRSISAMRGNTGRRPSSSIRSSFCEARYDARANNRGLRTSCRRRLVSLIGLSLGMFAAIAVNMGFAFNLREFYTTMTAKDAAYHPIVVVWRSRDYELHFTRCRAFWSRLSMIAAMARLMIAIVIHIVIRFPL